MHIPAVLNCIAVLAEDILDEVSVLTLTGPDETLEEGPQLLLQSPAGHQEGRISVGAAPKVGRVKHGLRYGNIV